MVIIMIMVMMVMMVVMHVKRLTYAPCRFMKKVYVSDDSEDNASNNDDNDDECNEILMRCLGRFTLR